MHRATSASPPTTSTCQFGSRGYGGMFPMCPEKNKHSLKKPHSADRERRGSLSLRIIAINPNTKLRQQQQPFRNQWLIAMESKLKQPTQPIDSLKSQLDWYARGFADQFLAFSSEQVP